MNVYLLPGLCGLLLGLMLHWAGFTRQDALRNALGLRRSFAVRSGLYAVGAGMALTALLCWLAVIDVDTVEVLPLSLGALTGGAVFGAAAALAGYTPLTAFGGLGGGAAAEALCCMAGCLLGAWVLPGMDGLLAPLRTAAPYAAATLFEVTLDEPWLLDGGFLGQGCAGLLLMAAAVCSPSPRIVQEVNGEAPSAPEADAVPPVPEDAPQETFVALLPGEEPLVVDTAADVREDAADEGGGEEDAVREDAPSADTAEASPEGETADAASEEADFTGAEVTAADEPHEGVVEAAEDPADGFSAAAADIPQDGQPAEALPDEDPAAVPEDEAATASRDAAAPEDGSGPSPDAGSDETPS